MSDFQATSGTIVLLPASGRYKSPVCHLRHASFNGGDGCWFPEITEISGELQRNVWVTLTPPALRNAMAPYTEDL
jgi:hypothetical protein